MICARALAGVSLITLSKMNKYLLAENENIQRKFHGINSLYLLLLYRSIITTASPQDTHILCPWQFM